MTSAMGIRARKSNFSRYVSWILKWDFPCSFTAFSHSGNPAIQLDGLRCYLGQYDHKHKDEKILVGFFSHLSAMFVFLAVFVVVVVKLEIQMLLLPLKSRLNVSCTAPGSLRILCVRWY